MGPHGRANRRNSTGNLENQARGPPNSLPEEGAPGGVPPGAGRPLGSPDPGWAPIQVHFGGKIALIL
jgi:hypothetical protein